jgi:hypothetical protein
MAVAFVNSGVIQPLVNQEVIVATLGGGSFDNLDAYVQGGQWDGQLSFRIYATNGAVRARVAQAAYQGPRAARLFWQVIGQTQPQSPLSCDGTNYDLVVFALPNPQNNGLNPVPPGTIQATLAGVNDGDVVADTNVSAAPVLPALGGEVVVATAAGYVERADVAVNMAGLPAVQLNLYASCGAGSVQALVQFTQTGGADQSEAVMVGVPLPVGTLFTLTAQKVVGDGVVGQACPASLATGSFASSGGGIGLLSPQVTGPLNNNVITQGIGSIIYKPGVPSSSDTVATWVEVQAKIASWDGKGIVYIDDSVVSPAPVPGATGVTQCDGRVVLMPANYNAVNGTFLQIQNGATLENLPRITGPLVVTCASTSAVPSLDFDYVRNNALFLDNSAQLLTGAAATQPGFVVPVGKTLILQAHLFAGMAVVGASVLGHVLGTLDLTTFGGSVSNGCFDGGGTLDYSFDVPSLILAGNATRIPTQTVTTYTFTQNDDSPLYSGEIDFVLHCGGDPTGTSSAANVAAMTKAFALLSAIAGAVAPGVTNATRLYFPPGVYLFSAGNGLWNFAGLASSVEVCGVKGASIIQLNGLGVPWLVVANCQTFDMHDLTVVGTGATGAVTDVSVFLEVNASIEERFHDMSFYSVVAVNALIIALGISAVFEDIFIGDCQTQDSTNGMLVCGSSGSLGIGQCTFRNVTVEDGGVLNNVSFPNRTGNSVEIQVFGPCQSAIFENCTLDEVCIANVVLDGTLAPVEYARLDGCRFNPPNGGVVGAIASISAKDCQYLEVNRLHPTTAGGNTYPSILLTSVWRAKLTRIGKASGVPVVVRADAATRYVEVVDPDGWGAPATNINAAVTVLWRDFGTDTEVDGTVLAVGAAGSFVGALMKIASVGGVAGLALVLTTDGVGLGTHVSLDLIAGAGSIRAARRGQRVTILSDGSTAIAIGDPITNLGAAASGQVKKAVATGTTPIIGTAASVAASGGGAVLFDMFFETGEA